MPDLATRLDLILLTTHDKVREAMHKWDKPVFEAPRRIVFWISTTAYVCGAIGVAMIFAAVVGR